MKKERKVVFSDHWKPDLYWCVDLTVQGIKWSMFFDSKNVFQAQIKQIKHKASLKSGQMDHNKKCCAIRKVLNTYKFLANKYRKKRKNNSHTCRKKPSNLIFSSVALQVPQPLALHLLSTVFFSRSAWHIRVCRPTNLSSGRTPFSVRILKAQNVFFFYFQHCQYKTSASCL